MKAWHLCGDTLRDGRPVPADGVTLSRVGLRGYGQLIDALYRARGNTICRVDLGGEITRGERGCLYPYVEGTIATRRTILWRVDGEDVLRRFARRCALDVIHLWRASDAVIRYLKTGEGRHRAAESVTWSRPYAGLEDTDRDLTESAARVAAWQVVTEQEADAWSMADAASGAARAAAIGQDNPSRDNISIKNAQNRRLTAMVMAQHRRGI